jgi:predicted ATP-dependent endonuclease of OLD family
MITLKSVKINKYKSIETEQSFSVERDITTLVGKNEAGKTAILEAIAKSNYFVDDPRFVFDATYDYPRKEKKAFDKSREDTTVITCVFHLSDQLLAKIQADVGANTFTTQQFSRSKYYRSKRETWSDISANLEEFFEHFIKLHGITLKGGQSKLKSLTSVTEIDNAIAEAKDTKSKSILENLKPYFKNEWGWANPIAEYIARKWITPNLPKFLYYDEYYALPSEININQLQSKNLDNESLKTSRALFELADINIDQLLNDDNYEPYKAELEATSNQITATLFEYWKTNTNLRVEFDIQKQLRPNTDPQKFDAILKIRVWNNKYQMSLPLASRSKGFNWFFSFIVWFSKIQEDKNSNYVLLLDEPGLNLHATAQEDLLKYLEDLAVNYQIIYTTHSPFMVATDKLHRVRTVVETDQGTKISDSIQEKDPDTLFPLQAALGYDIAQNLFIGKNNLLIEGASDLVYLTIMSGILEKVGRTGLREDITLVPVGGLDKVTTFISLLRGQKLKIACLLDTFTDQKGKSRVEDLVREKIIKDTHIRFFDEFAAIGGIADLEDLFDKSEYLKLFNSAFSNEHKNLSLSDLDAGEPRIVVQINKALGIQRFNHYRPANELARSGADATSFSSDTLARFEAMFTALNKLF